VFFETEDWNPSKKYRHLIQVILFGVTMQKEIKPRHRARFAFPFFLLTDKQTKSVFRNSDIDAERRVSLLLYYLFNT
jgi:hypothetical protein